MVRRGEASLGTQKRDQLQVGWGWGDAEERTRNVEGTQERRHRSWSSLKMWRSSKMAEMLDGRGEEDDELIDVVKDNKKKKERKRKDSCRKVESTVLVCKYRNNTIIHGSQDSSRASLVIDGGRGYCTVGVSGGGCRARWRAGTGSEGVGCSWADDGGGGGW